MCFPTYFVCTIILKDILILGYMYSTLDYLHIVSQTHTKNNSAHLQADDAHDNYITILQSSKIIIELQKDDILYIKFMVWTNTKIMFFI